MIDASACLVVGVSKGCFDDDDTPTSDEGGECNDTVTILP